MEGGKVARVARFQGFKDEGRIQANNRMIIRRYGPGFARRTDFAHVPDHHDRRGLDTCKQVRIGIAWHVRQLSEVSDAASPRVTRG